MRTSTKQQLIGLFLICLKQVNAEGCSSGDLSCSNEPRSTIQCSPGETISSKAGICEFCAPGTYELKNECHACSEGSVAPAFGSLSCIECPSGTHSSQDESQWYDIGSSSSIAIWNNICTPCSIGTYSPPASSYCMNCLGPGSISCDPITGAATGCLKGYYLSNSVCVIDHVTLSVNIAMSNSSNVIQSEELSSNLSGTSTETTVKPVRTHFKASNSYERFIPKTKPTPVKNTDEKVNVLDTQSVIVVVASSVTVDLPQVTSSPPIADATEQPSTNTPEVEPNLNLNLASVDDGSSPILVQAVPVVISDPVKVDSVPAGVVVAEIKPITNTSGQIKAAVLSPACTGASQGKPTNVLAASEYLQNVVACVDESIVLQLKSALLGVISNY